MMPTMDLDQTASDVRRARMSRGWSQKQAAEVAHIAPNTMGRIELGKPVRPGTLRAVLDVLEIEASPPKASAPSSGQRGAVVAAVRILLASLDEADRADALRDIIIRPV